ncbi:MAG: hypothetical protein R6U11_00405 [Bacteroidales bacterium]
MESEPKKKNRISLPEVSKKTFWLFTIGFILLGIAGGYLYYQQIGCRTGSCSLQSNPYFSMLWGGAIGYVLPDLFLKKKKNKE